MYLIHLRSTMWRLPVGVNEIDAAKKFAMLPLQSALMSIDEEKV